MSCLPPGEQPLAHDVSDVLWGPGAGSLLPRVLCAWKRTVRAWGLSYQVGVLLSSEALRQPPATAARC